MASIGRVVCVLVIAPACFHPTYDHPTCGPGGECPAGWTCNPQGTCEFLGGGAGGIDGGGGADGCTTFSQQVNTCGITFGGDLMLMGNLTYDTGTHELRDGSGAMVPVMHARLTAKEGDVDAIYAHNVRLTMSTVLRAKGALPFAIVASGSVTLDAGAKIDLTDGGAGAQAMCSTPATVGVNSGAGGAGGGGGGFSGAGGKGGDGNTGATPPNKSNGGAGAGSIPPPRGPSGGCAGAAGGIGVSAGGSGGLGGGALYLVATDRIDLGSGAVLVAGGGGGKGGNSGSGVGTGGGGGGGGGGGSGGMIWLEAPHIVGASSMIAANGGGGGEGGDTMSAGKDGPAGNASVTRAPGGTGGTLSGGDGGRGGAEGAPAGETGNSAGINAGGGGGGGGIGYIHVVSADQQLGTVSPAAQ